MVHFGGLNEHLEANFAISSVGLRSNWASPNLQEQGLKGLQDRIFSKNQSCSSFLEEVQHNNL